MPPTCYRDDCNELHHAQGLCLNHYTQQRRAAHKNGTWESIYAPSDLFRTTVQQFLDAGYNYSMLEALTGIERNTFSRCFLKDRQLVTEDNLDKLRRLPLVPLYELWKTDIGVDYKVPSYLASRRVRALMARGWTTTALAEEVGMERRSLQRIAHESKKFPWIFRSNLVKIDEAYNRLWDKEPPATHRHSDATRYQHWPLPMEWDDEALDLPSGAGFAYRRAKLRLRRTQAA